MIIVQVKQQTRQKASRENQGRTAKNTSGVTIILEAEHPPMHNQKQ
jgi:hypothetical protein